MVDKVYWTSIEYVLENNFTTKGGMVYAFTRATDARVAIKKFIDKLLKVKKNSIIIEVEFVSPYSLDIEWESKKDKSNYESLYHKAISQDEVVFDTFYEYGFEE